MDYKNYGNGNNFIILGVLLLLFFGGLRVLFLTVSVLILFVIQFFPLIIISWLIFYFLRRSKYNLKMGEFVQKNSLARNHFVELLVRILILAVKADGKVDDREIAVIKQFFIQNLGYNQLQMNWVTDLINHSLKHPESLETLTSEVNTHYKIESKLIVLQLVYRVVIADGVLSGSEEALIKQFVSQCRIPKAEHEKIKAFFVSNTDDISVHYQRLGVEKGASKEAIKKAYRTATKKYHPDKVHHLGEEFRKTAEEKMQDINESYDKLVKSLE